MTVQQLSKVLAQLPQSANVFVLTPDQTVTTNIINVVVMSQTEIRLQTQAR